MAESPDYLQKNFTLKTTSYLLELEEYEFFHSPFSLDEKKLDTKFIGRDKELSRLRLILENSKTKSGAYLITGFRGMGKTSIVRKAIKQVNEENIKINKVRKYIPIEVSLAQDDLEEMDVFRLISRHMLNSIRDIYTQKRNGPRRLLHPQKAPRIKKALKSILKDLEELNYRISAEIESGNFSEASSKLGLKTSGVPSGINGEWSDSIRSGKSRNLKYPLAGTKEIESILIQILKKIEKYRADLGDFSDRSWENLFKDYHIPDFLFIFDELDKIEPQRRYTLEEKEAENPYFDRNRKGGGPEKIRSRRRTIEDLFANLKNFLNTARAKFVFIGGREMYDASLADIADRDSFYSSIFHDVIYIESFLKNGTKGKSSGLTRMTEMYLCKLLIPQSFLMCKGLIELKEELNDKQREGSHEMILAQPNDYPEEAIYNLRTYHEYLCEVFLKEKELIELKNNAREGASPELKGPLFLLPEMNMNKYLDEHPPVERYSSIELFKVIYLLQNYIIYLTYRSNGTPKKLTSLIEDLLISDSHSACQQEFTTKIEFKKVVKWNPPKQQTTKIFLHFNELVQYEIGVHSAIYRPYIISNSRYKKHWGDKLLFSTSYIIDHIFKFHPFGFSWGNLELIPEIITINKAPNLRSFIRELMEHYSETHIRSSVGGLYHYKFFNKASNEIKYLSKVSELSSAAFNFTLDESLMIKRHYHGRLNDLQKKHEKYESYPERTRYINSIGFIQRILGDLHYFDKEFDEASVQYSDALQHLRGPAFKLLTPHQKALKVTLMLKLGLTLEKVHEYQPASTIYEEVLADISDDVKESNRWFTMLELHERSSIHEPKGRTLMTQVFIAQMALVEKITIDGISERNIKNLEDQYMDFLKFDRDMLLESVASTRSRKKTIDQDVNEEIENDLPFSLISNYYHNQGGLLYYKNRNHLFLLRRFAAYDPEFTKVLRNTEGKRINQAYLTYLIGLKGENSPNFYPTISAYVSYREGLRWFLMRYQYELEEIRKGIQANPQASEFSALFLASKASLNPYLLDIMILLSDRGLSSISSKEYETIGNILTKMGDCLATFLSPVNNAAPTAVSFVKLFSEYEIPGNTEKSDRNLSEDGLDTDKDDSVPHNMLIRNLCEVYRDIINRNPQVKATEVPSGFYSHDMVFFTYRLASLFYEKAGNNYSQAFQYKKVLHVINDFLGSRTRDEIKQQWTFEVLDEGKAVKLDFIGFLKEKLAVPVFRAITRESRVSNRPQILKYKDIFRLQRVMDNTIRQDIYTNISTGVEVWEIVLLISNIQVEYHGISPEGAEALDHQLDYSQYAPAITNSSKFLRMMELKYKTDLNWHYYQRWEGRFKKIKLTTSQTEEYKAAFHLFESNEKLDDDQVRDYLIVDSIGNLAELIHTMNVYDQPYMAKYSYLGFAHSKLAEWCDKYRDVLRGENKSDLKKDIFKKIKLQVGEDFMYYLDANYHRELAIDHFSSLIELHSGGKAYQKEKHNMFFLEDDHNDNLYHFCAAMERYKINTGIVQRELDRLNSDVEKGKLKEDGTFSGGSKLYFYETYHSHRSEESSEDDEPADMDNMMDHASDPGEE